VIKRDNVTRDEVLARIKHQWPDEQKIPLSDYIIYNDGARSLIEQVMDIDVMIRKV
jgi:dephospho-CoA kinase